jgi:hypothetical protein
MTKTVPALRILVCDRCKAETPADEFKGGCRLVVRLNCEHYSEVSDSTYDLCGKCMDAFGEFLRKNH